MREVTEVLNESRIVLGSESKRFPGHDQSAYTLSFLYRDHEKYDQFPGLLHAYGHFK